MDRFLYAHNPMNPAGKYGVQGYIIDTVKQVWVSVDVQPFKHLLQVVVSSGSIDTDKQSCARISRWYDSWCAKRHITPLVEVSFILSPTLHEPGTDSDSV